MNMLNAVILNVSMLSVTFKTLSQSVVILNVILMGVVVLNVVAPFYPSLLSLSNYKSLSFKCSKSLQACSQILDLGISDMTNTLAYRNNQFTPSVRFILLSTMFRFERS